MLRPSGALGPVLSLSGGRDVYDDIDLAACYVVRSSLIFGESKHAPPEMYDDHDGDMCRFSDDDLVLPAPVFFVKKLGHHE